eukprot:GHVS01027675.1.p2 GENE.GHVS01027675.1~~GHVS01027675.1.p2  ORF type:complete len:111 (-),score=31.40 GHVS01027675.1:541-873(-)
MASVPHSLLHSPIPPSRSSRMTQQSRTSSSIASSSSMTQLAAARPAPIATVWHHSEEEMFLRTVLSVVVAVGEFIPAAPADAQLLLEREVYQDISKRHDICEQTYPVTLI